MWRTFLNLTGLNFLILFYPLPFRSFGNHYHLFYPFNKFICVVLKIQFLELEIIVLNAIIRANCRMDGSKVIQKWKPWRPSTTCNVFIKLKTEQNFNETCQNPHLGVIMSAITFTFGQSWKMSCVKWIKQATGLNHLFFNASSPWFMKFLMIKRLRISTKMKWPLATNNPVLITPKQRIHQQKLYRVYGGVQHASFTISCYQSNLTNLRTLITKTHRFVEQKIFLFHQGKSEANIAKITRGTLAWLQLEILSQPSYSSDLLQAKIICI